jgi:hypothetical protein
MTRAEMCIAACEGLTDDQVKALVSAGGLIHLLEQYERVDGVKIAAVMKSIQEFPALLAGVRGNVGQMRSLLIATLAEIDGL